MSVDLPSTDAVPALRMQFFLRVAAPVRPLAMRDYGHPIFPDAPGDIDVSSTIARVKNAQVQMESC